MESLTFDQWLAIAGIVLGVFGIAVGVGVAIAVEASTRGEFYFAIGCFWFSAIMLCGSMALWAVSSPEFDMKKLLLVGVLFGLVGVGLTAAIRWTRGRHERASPAVQPATAPQIPRTTTSPSFLFVIGAPLGDNESATWIMLVRHYGPSRAYDCRIEFVDLDRKNIGHEWLVRHPNTPFLPPGMFDASQTTLHITEAGPEPATASSFNWRPLDPNRQHYTVNISCRDGYFTENWEVVRVNGILRAKVIVQHGPQWIQNNPDLSPTVFQYQDSEFVSTPLLTEIPEKHAKEVHFGWKPNYKFSVPVAIINSDGNVTVMSGVKLPDGSTRTDFGCWNLLTKHFGDEASKQPPRQ